MPLFLKRINNIIDRCFFVHSFEFYLSYLFNLKESFTASYVSLHMRIWFSLAILSSLAARLTGLPMAVYSFLIAEPKIPTMDSPVLIPNPTGIFIFLLLISAFISAILFRISIAHCNGSLGIAILGNRCSEYSHDAVTDVFIEGAVVFKDNVVERIKIIKIQKLR